MKKFLDWIEAKVEFLWRKAEDASENDARSLSLLRILYGLFIVLFYTPSFFWIGKVPQSLFLPPFLSLGILFDDFPSYHWLLAIDISLIICTICLLLGIKARYAGIFFSLFYIIGSSFQYSFGKIDHYIMFPVFILGLSLTNWGVNYALIPDKKVSKEVQRKVLAILAVLVCFGMFTSGYEKALYWIDFDLEKGGFLAWFSEGFFSQERKYLLAPFVLLVPPKIFEIFDYFAVVFELSPMIALLTGRKWWQLWLLVACIFHLGNTLLLNIPFASHAPIYLSFIPVNSFMKMGEMHLSKVKVAIFAFTTTTVIAIHYVFYFSTNNSIKPMVVYILPRVQNERMLSLYVGLLMWILTTYLVGLGVVKTLNISKKYRN
jgi:uncharacterized membrane protein YphA (DoxX/SURF4 family)